MLIGFLRFGMINRGWSISMFRSVGNSVAPIIGSIIGIGPILATSRLIGFD